jgi:hypothetical protein
MEPEKSTRAKDYVPGPDQSGVNTRAILKFTLALLIIGIVVHITMWWLFKFFNDRLKSEDPQLSPLVPKQQVLPAEPRLQALPNKTNTKTQIFDVPEVDADVRNDAELLKQYGWIDPKNGIVRIPIDDAIKLFVEKEKQTQTAPATQTNKTTNDQQ